MTISSSVPRPTCQHLLSHGGSGNLSTVYSAGDKAGTTMSCEAAWTYIADKLADPTLFDTYSDQICARTGFDVTQTTARSVPPADRRAGRHDARSVDEPSEVPDQCLSWPDCR
jgi:hypothetical protein